MRFALVVALPLVALSLSCSTVRQLPERPAELLPGKALRLETDEYLAYLVSVDIAAEPARVWALLQDVTTWPTWNSTIVRIEGSAQQGGTVKLVSKLDPEREFALKVTTVEPERRMVWEDGMPMGLFAGVRSYELSPVEGGGTRFAMSEVLSGGMLGMIGGSIPDMTASFEAFAADLKKAAEQ